VERPRWGYRRLYVVVRRGGVVVNCKRVYRVYRAAGLAVRRRRRKRVAVARRPLVPATRPNERWSMDFVADRFGAERRFRALTLVDDFTRECLALEVDTSLPGERVCRALDRLPVTRGLPATIVTDNGPEFAGRALDVWAYQHRVQLAFIQPGKPTQNAYVESFNGKVRDDCLVQHRFLTLVDSRLVLDHRRHDYNSRRPRSSLDNLTPSAFLHRWALTHAQPMEPVSTIRIGTA
jgi:putative transposase